MPANIVPFKRSSVIPADAVLSEQVRASQRPGINAVVRIQGAAFASSVAMQQAASLSQSADTAFRQSPMGEDIYRAILNAFGNVAVAEITALAFGKDEVQ